MNFKKEFNTLVIAGSWNNAIINPEWITKYILNDTTMTVEIPLNVNASFRMSTDELRIFTLEGKLNFAVLKQEDNVFEKIGSLGISIADKLIHTPVTAFGINFVFECDRNEKMDNLFSLMDTGEVTQSGFVITGTQIRREMQSGDKHLNLNIVKANDSYSFDFNYHTAIKSLVEFKDKFDETDIVKYKKESIEFLNKFYELEMV